MRTPGDDRTASNGALGPVSAARAEREDGRIAVRSTLSLRVRRGKTSQNKGERGFTAVPNFVLAITDARNAKAVGDIRTIEDGIELYLVVNNVLPDDLSQVGYGGFLDPWGNPYQYLNHSTMHGNGQARKDRFLVPLNSDFDLYSMGPDGRSVSPITAQPSRDDIIRAADGSYIGLASQF